MIIQLRLIFFFKQKTAYEMRISDWSSDVCSSDLQQSNPKMLRACYKDAVRNPLVANAGLIHKRGECGPVLCAFSVGGAAASCQLPIIGRQRRRTAGTRRVVAIPTGRKRTGSTRTWPDRLEGRLVGKECVGTCRSRGSQ